MTAKTPKELMKQREDLDREIEKALERERTGKRKTYDDELRGLGFSNGILDLLTDRERATIGDETKDEKSSTERKARRKIEEKTKKEIAKKSHDGAKAKELAEEYEMDVSQIYQFKKKYPKDET